MGIKKVLNMGLNVTQFPGMSEREFKELTKTHLNRQWLSNYLRLRLFVQTFKRQPKQTERYPKGILVGAWASLQRNMQYNGMLLNWRYELLDRLGFDWGRGKRIDWNEMFDKAKKIQREKGAPLSRYTKDEDEKQAKCWLYQQAKDIRNGQLDEQKIRKLHEAGLIVNRIDYRWEKFYKELQGFVETHQRLPSAWSEDAQERSLGKQRGYHGIRMNEGKLTAEQTARLRAMGVEQKINEKRWEETFKNVREIFQDRIKKRMFYGPTGIRQTLGEEYYVWLLAQRGACRKGIRTPKQVQLLKDEQMNYTTNELLQMSRKGEL